jgi:hypothetical protein
MAIAWHCKADRARAVIRLETGPVGKASGETSSKTNFLTSSMINLTRSAWLMQVQAQMVS